MQVVSVTCSGGGGGTAALPASLEGYRCVKLLCLGHMLTVNFVLSFICTGVSIQFSVANCLSFMLVSIIIFGELGSSVLQIILVSIL